MSNDLFSEQYGAELFIDIALPDASVRLYPALFASEQADTLMTQLSSDIVWTQDKMTVYGREHDLPRLTAWYGDAGVQYTYSGISAVANPWIEPLLIIKRRIEEATDSSFNSVLLNRYRTGADGMGWHSDDEPELGRNPVIASVSLGQDRSFHLKHKTLEGVRENIRLEHGSLLLMSGETQHHWLHQVPKSRRHMNERINLTFRTIK
ncbi:MAG: alpha-ketoglutarate-dependent dioxygenase AlkB [Halioglobus sp.]